jgi:hypothetical protein
VTAAAEIGSKLGAAWSGADDGHCVLAEKHNNGEVTDRVFDRRMFLARLRGNLEPVALQVEASMRREGLPVTPDNLALRMQDVIARTKPRSRIVPWHLPTEIVGAAIEWTAREIALELYPKC